MNDERRLVRGPELARWLLVAALILIGIGLYVAFGPRSRPAAPPAAQEAP